MKTYKLILSYDGSRYNGWQRQGNTGNTIQEKVEFHLSALLRQPVEIAASGRTDSGVHALAQVCSFRADTELSTDDILSGLRGLLPSDIGAMSIEPADDRFHARLCARGKTYIYKIHNSAVPDVFGRKFCYSLPEPLDIPSMRASAALLCGTHDFLCFSSLKKSKKSTVRTVDRIEISEDGNNITLSFTGDGFLYNMVRIMTGTLIEVGLGKRLPESIPAVFESGSRSDAGFTAPAEGLFLKEVYY